MPRRTPEKQASAYPGRVILAIAAAAFFALLASAALLKEGVSSFFSAQPDLVTMYEQRYLELQRVLPARGTVGYITDLPPEDTRARTESYLLQYAIAPLILENSSEQPLVIGNFHTSAGYAEATKNKKLVLVRDFGNGVMLFQK